ncbi:partner and localizer of BRCA2 [Willisornis vidua]|uniref:Partner and localizer of BRCA2 n=1 Tax=Willisornis vidua TaxID=1566151 RepID=A0ABQ9DRS1_9PASS|nr:partner and localizer of BRCA2 [Willisornis vidua]
MEGARALSGAQREKVRCGPGPGPVAVPGPVPTLAHPGAVSLAAAGEAGVAEAGVQRDRHQAAGSKDNASPSADRGGPTQLQVATCSDVDTEKATSVTCKHIPEFCSGEVSLQDSSQAESVQASQENLCSEVIRPVPEEKTPQTSRGMKKLRRQTKALESKQRKSGHDGHVMSTDETVKNQIASAKELQSPVFRHSTLSHTEERAERASVPALVKGQGNSFTPAAASGVVQEVFEDSVAAGEPELSPHVLRDSSDVWQPKSPRAVTTPGSREPHSQHGDSVLLDTRGDRGEESSCVIKQLESKDLYEGQGELQGLLDLMSENEVLPDNRNDTVTKESKSHEGIQSDADTLNPCPADPALGNAEQLLENQQLEIQSRLSPSKEVTAPRDTLSSCTVVEGLLFPVEYYVRTTRRMSNCQRKVDLDAVILSQLGRSKKGQRSKCKQKDANSDQPFQESTKGDLESGVMLFPLRGAKNDVANSSSSEKSLPVSSSSTSLGSISQESTISPRREQSQSQRKQKRRRKSACKAPVHPVSQELIESQALITAREGSAVLSSESQSEKENCDANPEKSSSDERKLFGAAAPGSGETAVTGAAQPVGPEPPQGGSQVPGQCCETLLEQVQNPLQSSNSIGPGNETFTSHVADLEANSPVCQADGHPVARVTRQQGACRAERAPGVSVPLRRSLRCAARHRARPGPAGDSSRGHSCPTGSEGPAALHLPAADPDTRCSLFSFRSLQWLVPRLGIRDFHLPNEEFGVLKLEKLESSPVNDLESFVPSVSGDGVAPEDTPGAQMNPEEKNLRSHLILPSKSGLPKLPPMDSPASKKEISTHELLFTPVGTVLVGPPAQPESQISSSVFPAVGATPGVLPSVHSEIFPDTPSVPASQVALPSGAAQALGHGAHKDPAMPLHPDSCGAGAARKEEEEGTTFPAAGERGPENRSDQAVALDKHQQSESKEQRSCKASPEQKKHVAEWLAPVLADGPREENLQLMSELKIPVIQIVPLPDTCNLVCVALGELEIGEIRILLYSSETDSFKHSLVKTGNIKAVVGLKDQRLVSSSRTLQEQQVEMVSLSGTGGSKDRQTLMPPEETVTAFAEVEGMKEALVGTTAANSIVVWYLEGDVWDTAGAAVLTSGAVAVWDLLRGRCVAVLPPGPSRRWALARWAVAGAGLLAGQRDGTVHLYRYRQPQPGAA